MENNHNPNSCCPTPPQVVSVQSVLDIKQLANVFVYVIENNTTYFVSSCHEITIIYSGPVFVDDYDYQTNPLNLRSQTVYDFANNMAIHYGPKGDYRLSVLKEVL